MISSTSGPGLLFPKGGWENDETAEEAAEREAMEEAGVRGNYGLEGESESGTEVAVVCGHSSESADRGNKLLTNGVEVQMKGHKLQVGVVGSDISIDRQVRFSEGCFVLLIKSISVLCFSLYLIVVEINLFGRVLGNILLLLDYM